MRFLTAATLAGLALSALAQRSFIEAPPAGTNLSPGQQFTVQLVRPNSLQGSVEVGLAIGLQVCQSGTCAPPNEQLGSLLYNQPFNPVLHEQPGRPYENFTVTVPDYFPPGPVQLATARLHLIGAGPSPTLELNQVLLNIVAP